jgi:hypothetical protein
MPLRRCIRRKEVNMTRFPQVIRAHPVASPVCMFAVMAAVSLAVVLSIRVSVARAASPCPSANFCLYQNADQSGTQWNQNEANDGTNVWHQLDAGHARDNATSYSNQRVNKTLVRYTSSSPSYCLGRGWQGNFVLDTYSNGVNLANHVGWVFLYDTGGISDCS